ncbi:hypothetical protein CEXT_8001 [Caerostris extrusa]|uniref:Uncharacterized protein n=1 Tax=Caerostris extrusa TaxID=172846 RepID=A0AAV4S1L0_CAEEX|nr:hypothetical protein CEXT_8001 [Caerostris extrusa]
MRTGINAFGMMDWSEYFWYDELDQWAGLIVLSLQLWIYISMFRSRTKIRLLTEDLYRISNMLHAHTLQKKKMLKICIWLYCLFVILGTAFFDATFSVLVCNEYIGNALLVWLHFCILPNDNNMLGIFFYGISAVLCVADDDLAFSCSCQSSCGEGEGNCSVFARLVSKGVQHRKITCL